MKQPPTDPPSHRPSADASARRAEDSPSKTKRPGGHGSYRITELPPEQRPGGHGSEKFTDSPLPRDKYDDGVVHVPHYDADGYDDLHNEETAHEHIDVDVRAVGMSAVILAVVALASMGAMYVLFDRLEAMAAANEPHVSPLATPATQMPPSTRETPYFSRNVGGPQLLTDEPRALREERDKEAKRLHGYGWISQPAGVAHVPIEQAKKLILERGLPARPEPVPPTFGTRLPAAGEASSGRVITTTPPDRPAAAEGGEQKPPAPAPHKPGGH